MKPWSVLVVIVLAGCAQTAEPSAGEPADALPSGSAAGSNATAVPGFNATAAYRQSTCDSACDFGDELYHQYVVYQVEEVEIDVLIMPAASGAPLEDIQAARDAVADWRRGLEEFAPDWLLEGLDIRIYAVGIDVPTAEAVADPEIIVLLAYGDRDGTRPTYLGIGAEPQQIACGGDAEPLFSIKEPGFEVHGMNCLGLEYRCLAINTITSDTPDRVTNIVMHEVGHCLGVGHVGNAGDFQARYHPYMDAMSYGGAPDRTRCVSNMDIDTLARIYAPLLDTHTVEPLLRGQYNSYDPTDYRQGSCSPVEGP